jgi:predicted dienelactone hydrolase
MVHFPDKGTTTQPLKFPQFSKPTPSFEFIKGYLPDVYGVDRQRRLPSLLYIGEPPLMTRILTQTILLCFVLSFSACSSGPSLPEYTPDALGADQVGYLTFEAVDASRNDRSLVIDVWYPADRASTTGASAATYPLSAIFGMESDVALDQVAVRQDSLALLIFSHGYGGINRQSIALMEALASHGFIVAAPEHTGNAQNSFTDTFDAAASNRVPDLSFVIDTMLNRGEDADDIFYNRIDPELIGALGHSFGGMTVIGSATGWAGAEADPRVKVIAPMSAVIDREIQEDERESENGGFSAEQLGKITIPTMLVGGTEDISVPIENNDIAFSQITQAPTLYKVAISGANHTHFTNVCDIGDFLIETGFAKENWENMGAGDLIDPYNATCTEEAFPMAEFNRLLNIFVVSFFKLELMGDEAFQSYLGAEFASGEPAVELNMK